MSFKIKSLEFLILQHLTEIQTKFKLSRAKELFDFHKSGDMPSLTFCDEKTFLIPQVVNNQKRDYFPPINLELLLFTTKLIMEIVCATITADVCFPFRYLDHGFKILKISTKYYQADTLERVLKPKRKYFSHRSWMFQQNSAPSYSAHVNQDYLIFPPHNGPHNFWMPIHWTFVHWIVWKVRLALLRNIIKLFIDHIKQAHHRKRPEIPLEQLGAAYDGLIDHLKTKICATFDIICYNCHSTSIKFLKNYGC